VAVIGVGVLASCALKGWSLSRKFAGQLSCKPARRHGLGQKKLEKTFDNGRGAD
jgi:hypothetical protein